MIVGFNIDSLDASKEKAAANGDLQINYSPKIEEVKSTKVSAFEDEVARISFTFTVNYTVGDIVGAKIEMKGNTLWKGDTEEIVSSWESDGSLPESVEAPLMNDLYRKCLSQAVGISDTLGLLPPIPTPRVDQ